MCSRAFSPTGIYDRKAFAKKFDFRGSNVAPLTWDLGKIFNRVEDSAVRIDTVDSKGKAYRGSGVLVADSASPHSCELVTVHHLTEGSENISVTTRGGETYPAELEFADENHQIDVYKLKDVQEPARACIGSEISEVDPIKNELTFALRYTPDGFSDPTPVLGLVIGPSSPIKIEVPDGDPQRSTSLLFMRALHGDSGAGVFNSTGKITGLVESNVGGLDAATGIENASAISAAINSAHAKIKER